MEVTCLAPAKLNLTLDILSRRADGYHELEMVMQTVALGDRVTLRMGTGSGTTALAAEGAALPAGRGNLAWEAAEAFFSAARMKNPGISILLEKRIPMQAGLAGGSADAAAVLRALRAAYRPEMPDEELERIGAAVGSDVPFCVRGGTVLARGRGERLRDLSPLPPCEIVLCKPEFGLSTPELFARSDAAQLSDRPSLPAMERALAAGDLGAVAAGLCNVFEQLLTEPERAAVGAIRDQMMAYGALGSCMSGSGPTVFGLFDDPACAQKAAAALQACHPQTFLTCPAENGGIAV